MNFLKMLLASTPLVFSMGACTNGPPTSNAAPNARTNQNMEAPPPEDRLPNNVDKEFGQAGMHLYSEVGGRIYRVTGTFDIVYDWDGDEDPDTKWDSFTARADSPAVHSVDLPPGVEFWVNPKNYRCFRDGVSIDCDYLGSNPEPFSVNSGTVQTTDLIFQIGGEAIVICDGSVTFRLVAGPACSHNNDCAEKEVCVFPSESSEGACAERAITN